MLTKLQMAVVAGLVAVAAVATLLQPEMVKDFVTDGGKDLLKAFLGAVAGFAVVQPLWAIWERYSWGGWSLDVTNRDGKQTQKALPASVIKKWLEDDLSDFGGFRDLTGSINRWPGCGLVSVDADEARRLGALEVDRKKKALRFNYQKLPAPATGQR